MSKQLQDAFIVAATRTPIGKAPRGMFQRTFAPMTSWCGRFNRRSRRRRISTLPRSRTRSSAALFRRASRE